MKPELLIGLPYRLGADPVKHGAADCLSLAKTLLASYGIETPKPTRDWYKRFRKREYQIFKEELNKWGNLTEDSKIGTVGLCKSNEGYGLAVYWEKGWLSCGESEVRWSPLEYLEVIERYYPMKSNFVKP